MSEEERIYEGSSTIRLTRTSNKVSLTIECIDTTEAIKLETYLKECMIKGSINLEWEVKE